MTRVVHFEVRAHDVARTARFYAQVFGWVAQQWEDRPYYLLTTGDQEAFGINGAVTQRREPGPASADATGLGGCVCTVSVDDVDERVRAVEAHGGGIVEPKAAMEGVGWLVYCRDPEGNVFGMLQPARVPA